MSVYLAKGTEVPEIGKVLRGYLQRLQKNGEWEFLTHTSEIKSVSPLGDDVYLIKTRSGTIYIYQLFSLENQRKDSETSEE